MQPGQRGGRLGEGVAPVENGVRKKSGVMQFLAKLYLRSRMLDAQQSPHHKHTFITRGRRDGADSFSDS